MKDDGNEFPLTDDFMKEFRSPKRFLSHFGFNGEKILPAYYDQNITVWNKIAVTERSIKNVEVEGVPIKGNLDKVEFVGKQVTVVDYKTGKLKYAKDKLLRPTTDQPNGGDYWRQAVFYKILIDSDHALDWEVVSTIFEFVSCS